MTPKDPLMARARKVKHKAASRLMAYPNVTGLGVGYKIIQGRRTDAVCLRVYVSRKVPETDLQPSEVLPREVEGIPVDVIEAVFEIQPNGTSPDDHQERHDPLLGGISVGNLDTGHTGTLGGWAVDNSSGELLILGNWHVLCGGLDCAVEDRLVQPGPGDGGSESDAVARLRRWALTELVDAAVGRLTGNRALLQRALGLGPVSDVREPVLGLPVKKSGRTTGVTTGIIADEQASLVVHGYPDGPRTFHNQIVIESNNNDDVSQPGDSGSFWLDEANWLVGLHFAGSPGRAGANRMLAVLDALNISIGLSVIDLTSASVALEVL